MSPRQGAVKKHRRQWTGLAPRLRPVAAGRRLLTELAHLRGDRLASAAEEGTHRVRQPAIDDEVHALGGARLEAAELLELTSRPGLEATELGGDAVLDGRVVADVEVEVAERTHRTPVATVEGVALLHVERAGDHLASLARHDQAEPVTQALSGQLEEAAVEGLLPPKEPLDGRLVDLEHPRHERRGDVGARMPGDLHALLCQRAALAAHLVATLAAQAGEVLV